MFYPTVKEYRPIRFKGYDIFLQLKLNNMMVASCLHDDGQNFTKSFMDYTKNEVVNLIKDEIKNRKVDYETI
jgi:hypothetical protein